MDGLGEGGATRGTTAWQQLNVSRNENNPGPGRVKNDALRRQKNGGGCRRGVDLSVGEQGYRAFMIRLGGIMMHQRVQRRENHHRLQRKKKPQQQRGSALPFPG